MERAQATARARPQPRPMARRRRLRSLLPRAQRITSLRRRLYLRRRARRLRRRRSARDNIATMRGLVRFRISYQQVLIALLCGTYVVGRGFAQTPAANPARPTVTNPATLPPVGYLQFEQGYLGSLESPIT